MNLTEAGTLLAVVQTYDNRTTNPGHVLAWQDALEPHTFQDCRDAVRDYYRHEARWIMPADVANRVREVESTRLWKVLGTNGPTLKDEIVAVEAGTYPALVQRLHRLVRHGVMTEPMYKNYLAKDLLLSDVVPTGSRELR